MNNFNIGDKVFIVKKIVPEGFIWVSSMDSYVGEDQIFMVEDIHENLCLIDGWYFPEGCLDISPGLLGRAAAEEEKLSDSLIEQHRALRRFLGG